VLEGVEMRIAMTGSHGLIGSTLARELTGAGHTVIEVPRGTSRAPGSDASPAATDPAQTVASVDHPDGGQTSPLFFDPDGGPSSLAGLEGVDAVIHLAGEPIGDHRWDARIRSRVYSSRVYGTRSLVTALSELAKPPKTVLVASASGFYGDRGAEELTEESSQGKGFLAKVVADWEAESVKAEAFGARVVLLRTGLVLDTKGGLLGRLLPLFRAGLGGRLATGSQYMSWITLGDEVRAIVHCLTTESVQGPVNLVAPNPVTNREFTRELAAVVHRPAVVSVPAFALEFVLGKEMAHELALVSQNIVPRALESSGFTFESTSLSSALQALVDAKK
jgi:uncharacterized protein (TIGR01777 family)